MYRILYAEDYPGQRISIARALRLRGFDVSAAEDGEEAWQLFAEQEFDLVLTDFGMPRMDGLKLIEQIRTLGSQIPIVLYCATQDLDIPEGVAYLDKSDHTIDFDTLAQRLREIIEKGEPP